MDAGVVTVRRAKGFVAGATPLLTGTLSGHPSNRTMYSGLKLPRTQFITHGSARHGYGGGGWGAWTWEGTRSVGSERMVSG